MTLQSVALFIHLLGLIALFSGFAVAQRGGAQLRRADTVEQVRVWIGLLQQTPAMFMAGLVMLLVSGLYMAGPPAGKEPWVGVALTGLVLTGVLLGVMYGPWLAAIKASAARASSGRVSADLARRIADRGRWTLLAAINGASIGIVWLMVVKPGWTGSVGAALAGGGLGAIVGAALSRAPDAANQAPALSER